MERKTVMGIMLTLLLTSMLTLAFNIQLVKASETIYIRADGSVEPSTANITSADNVTYYFTDNNYDGIVVERDNIVIDGAGYSVQGTESGKGIDLSNRSNVTIKNMEIKAFGYDIYLHYSSNNSIVGNNITNKWLMGIFHEGVYLYRSSDNNIVGNNITANNQNGIFLSSSSINNSIVGNNITNSYVGIWVDSSGNNTISGNNVSSNVYAGIRLDYSGSNHNEISSNIVSNNNYGIILTDACDNVVLSNVISNNGHTGIYPTSRSANNTFAGNVISNNKWGIQVIGSDKNCFSENEVFLNDEIGIYLSGSRKNILLRNNLSRNYDGISLWDSSNNTICQNNISYSQYGIVLANSSISYFCTNNTIYHNNFINNTKSAHPVSDFPPLRNIWDDGYPSGGNYWSDYEEIYPDAEELDGSGIWDTPYVIDENNQDNYPLMESWTPLPRTIGELKTEIEELGSEDEIDNQGIVQSLIAKLNVAQKLVDKGKVDKAEMVLNGFIKQVQKLSGIQIPVEAADILIQSAEYIISKL